MSDIPPDVQRVLRLGIMRLGRAVVPPSYIVFKVGGMVYTRNGLTGQVELGSTDASTVIQAVLDALSPGGGRVVIRRGVYEIRRTLRIPSNVVLAGEGASTVLINRTGATMIQNKGFGASPDYNIFVEDIYFDGGGLDYSIIDFSPVNNVAVRRCVFTNVGARAALAISDGSNFTVVNNYFMPPFGGDCFYSNNAKHLIVQGNHFEGAGDTGVAVDGSVEATRISIIGNTFLNCHYQAVSHGGNVNKSAIAGNTISGGRGGIRLDTFGYPEKPNLITINGNIISDTTFGVRLNVHSALVVANRFIAVGTPIEMVSGEVVVKYNQGYTTENGGVAVIAAGSTRVTVSHGLAKAPSKVLVTPYANARVWVENITGTSFDIVTDVAPASNVSVAWYAEV